MNMQDIHVALRLVIVLAFVAANARASESEIVATESYRVKLATIATGLEHPWGVAFLPDRRFLVTERPGRMRIVSEDGAISAPLHGVPPVHAAGQGGLLDVALAPDFPETQRIYFSFAEPREGGNGTSVARARLGKDGLTDVEVIFRQVPAADSPGHFGSRLLFAPDASLYVTLGERQAKHFTIRAQDLETHFGKIVRLRPDGSVPPDNPFVTVPGARPEIWSYGHRNVQGIAIHPVTGELWATEHGPKGGDELNRIVAAGNYGWPLVTHGIAYNGDRIGIGAARAGIEGPVHYWVPSIAVSSLAFYDGDRFPKWRGNALVTGLYGVLVRLELAGRKVVREERMLQELRERIRDVRVGPDGLLYVLTDSPRGRLVQVSPAD